MDKDDAQNNRDINFGNLISQTKRSDDVKKGSETEIPKMENILLNNTEGNNILNKKTAIRDPLFAARVLEEQNKVFKGTPRVKKNIDTVGSPFVGNNDKKTKKKFDRGALRTYRSDVTEMMRGQKTSLAQIVIAEQTKKEKNFSETSPRSKKNKNFKLLSVIFIVLSLFIISGGVYYFMQKRYIMPNKQEKKVNSIIFAELYKEIDLTNMTGQKIVDAVVEEIKNLDVRLDYIEYIYPVEIISGAGINGGGLKVSATAQTFFNKIDVKMPGTLVRSLDGGFMFGVHSFNGNQPFIILKTNFIENAFAGMLEWEKNMARGIFPLFNITTTPEIYDSKFEDTIIKNRDIRVLFNKDREIILLYTFFGKGTIIITTDKETLDEVITRIQRP